MTDVLPAAGSAADADETSLSDQLVLLVRVMHAFKAQATSGVSTAQVFTRKPAFVTVVPRKAAC